MKTGRRASMGASASTNGGLVSPPPHSENAEKGVVGSILRAPEPSIAKCTERRVSPDKFHLPSLQLLYTALCDMHDSGAAIDLITFTQFLIGGGLLEKVGGPAAVTALFNFVPTPANIDYYIDIVLENHAARELLATTETARQLVAARGDIADTVALVTQRLSVIEASLADSGHQSRFAAMLDGRRFNAQAPPPPALPRFSLQHMPICTPKNLTGVQAQAKGGKTGLLTGFIAATLDKSGAADCLGITSENRDGLAVIHFDSEQSPADHHAVVSLALRRAGISSQPEWLRSYRVADVPLVARQQLLPFEIERCVKQFGGVHSVFLDGAADFIPDPNDSEGSFQFVDKLHQVAIKHDTVVVAVIHENPSSELGKTRGHLGSQLERKAETNLRLAKDADGITTVYTERARHAHIPKEHGTRFVWSETANMHVTTDAKPKGRPKTYDADEIVQLIGGEFLSYSEAMTRCKEEGWKETTFKAHWGELKRSGRLKQSKMEPGKWGSR